jgi:hypothetical protein
MTDAEALAALRELLAAELRRNPRDINRIRYLLWDVQLIREGGVGPVIELRIRHRQRRAALRGA